MESDHSEESAADCAPARQTGVTLNHPESEEEMEMEEEMEEEEEREMEDDVNGEHYRADESLTDGGSFSIDRQPSEGSSGGGSLEETRSPSPGESLEKTSSVSEDVEELESSLDGSQGSSLKQRSLDVHKHSRHRDESSRRNVAF